MIQLYTGVATAIYGWSGIFPVENGILKIWDNGIDICGETYLSIHPCEQIPALQRREI